MPATAAVPPETPLAPAEEAALPEAAVVEPAPATATPPAATQPTAVQPTATQPAATSNATTTTSKPKKKATASNSDEGTLDKAGKMLGTVGNSIDGFFEGSTSSDTSNATKGK